MLSVLEYFCTRTRTKAVPEVSVMRDSLFGVSMRSGVLAAALLAFAFVGLAPRAAHADAARIAFLKERLRESERNDIKVRTSAALALGAMNEDGAGEPLCS